MKKLINKINVTLSVLLSISLFQGVLLKNFENKKENAKTLKNQYKNEGFSEENAQELVMDQITYFHNKDAFSYGLTDRSLRDIRFRNIYKNIFIDCNKLLKVNPASNFLKEAKQVTYPDLDNACGSFSYSGDEYDWYRRYLDWNIKYKENLYLTLQINQDKQYELVPRLSVDLLWEKDKELRHSLAPAWYETSGKKPDLISNPKDITFYHGYKRELHNWWQDIYGLNEVYFKENNNFYFFYNYVTRTYHTLGDTETFEKSYIYFKENKKKILPNIFDTSKIIYLNDHELANGIINLELVKIENYQQKDFYDNFMKIIDLVNFEIDYAIVNKQNKSIYENKKMIFKGSELKNNEVKIFLNKNKDDHYEFVLNNIKLVSVNQNDLYIDETNFNDVEFNHEHVLKENNHYIFKDYKVEQIIFDDESDQFNNLYVYQVPEKEVMEKYVKVYDSYKNKISYANIDPENLAIKKNTVNGSFEIKIINGNNQYKKTYLKFKRFEYDKTKFDAKKADPYLFVEQINDRKIKEIMLANGFDEYLLSLMSFEIIKKDAENGLLYFVVDHRVANDEVESFKNVIFEINNLNTIYCEKNENIKSDFLKLKPSEITEKIVLNHFLKISNHLKNDTNTKIKLKADDHESKLTVDVFYKTWDEKNEHKLFEFNFIKNDNNFWFVITISFSVISFLLILLIIYFDNKKGKVSL